MKKILVGLVMVSGFPMAANASCPEIQGRFHCVVGNSQSILTVQTQHTQDVVTYVLNPSDEDTRDEIIADGVERPAPPAKTPNLKNAVRVARCSADGLKLEIEMSGSYPPPVNAKVQVKQFMMLDANGDLINHVQQTIGGLPTPATEITCSRL